MTSFARGDVIADKYKVDYMLGKGGMGLVIAATHIHLGQRVALKFLAPELVGHPTIADRFLREARASALLRSEHICRVFDVDVLDGVPYFVMELLEGHDLARILDQRGPIPVPTLVDYILQACSGLAEAHARKIVHRDLKPANLFLTTRPDGTPLIKIVDFGIAKASDGLAVKLDLTQTATVMGSPGYMSPEQLRATREVDARSDIWALGVTLYELASGGKPFVAESLADLALRIAIDPLRPLTGRNIPRGFDHVVARCLEKDPTARYQGVNELAMALAAFGEPHARERALGVTRILSPVRDMEPRSATTLSGAVKSAPQFTVYEPLRRALVRIARGFRRQPSPDAMPPGQATAIPKVNVEEVSDIAKVLDGAIPPSFRDLLPHAIAFFRALFEDARKVGDRLIELRTPVIPELRSRSHHLLFLSSVDADSAAPFGQIGTRAFHAEVDPWAKQLANLKVPPRSVLITVLAAPQLGQGAREAIFTIHKEKNLLVVPIAGAEIRRACDAGNARAILLERIADLHTVSDPFATSDGSTDPTRWIGFAAEVSDLVKHIVAGGKIISVAGPPGSGKTSMVAMAQYGCDTTSVARQFVWIECGELSNRDPVLLLNEVTARVQRLRSDTAASAIEAIPTAPVEAPNLRATIIALGDQPPPSRVPTALGIPAIPATPARPSDSKIGLARRHQLVLVLEDADWLIHMASAAEPQEARHVAARELWRGLAELCSSRKHTVIVTSIRDFQIRELTPRERPIPVSRVPMRALTRRESEKLVGSLGELVAFQPTQAAYETLHHQSGGNIYALRLLCSEIIRAARERPDYSPLAPLRVTARMVRDAIKRIVATGASFQNHVAVWLDRSERIVLQYVARHRPRSLPQIHRALNSKATSDEIGNALDSLELMSLVEYQGRHHRVRIPLFERWINTRLDDRLPDVAERQLRRRTLITVGFTTAALLFGGYWSWLRSTRSSESYLVNSCVYELDRPDRIGPDDEMELFVYQDCSTPRPTRLMIESVLSALSPVTTSGECAASSMSCTMKVKMTAAEQAHDQYHVRLVVDGRPMITTAIDKDHFATIRAIGQHSVPLLSLITAAFTAVLGFHRKMKESLSQVWSDASLPESTPGPRPGRAHETPP